MDHAEEMGPRWMKDFEGPMRTKQWRIAMHMPLLVICAILLCGCYVLKQGRYVLKYSTEARRMEKLLRSADTPEDVKAFFSLVGQVRRYASDSIGLAKNDNFSTYIELHKSHIVDVVYGAGRLNFTPYTWRFPFFGTFPNKGFFDVNDAKKEADGLAKKGYDACIMGAGAFSTLGFFSDPVYSYMRQYSPFRLAFLIFHEQTHTTIFIKNQLQFNEELATFIGREGGLRFIKGKFGDTSEQYKSALSEVRDEDEYSVLMKSLHVRLKAIYNSAGLKDEDKLRQKQEIISRFRDSVALNYDSLFSSQAYRGLSKATINNATLVADMTYTLNLKLFGDLYERKNRDFKAMLSSIMTLKKKKGDPHERVRELVR
jgi:predicted aminopeptidase